MSEYDEATTVRIAREVVIQEANRLRTAAGPTPNPTQDTTDFFTAIDAQTGAQIQIPLNSFGTGDSGTTLVAEINWAGSYTNNGAQGIGGDGQHPEDIEWVVYDDSFNFGYDEFGGATGLLVTTDGIIEVLAYFYNVTDESEDPVIDVTGAMVDITVLGSTNPGVNSVTAYPVSSGAQFSILGQLRWVVRVDEWQVDADPTSTHNVMVQWAVVMPAHEGNISISRIQVHVLWTPASS